jgi:signal transduction histidine kinase
MIKEGLIEERSDLMLLVTPEGFYQEFEKGLLLDISAGDIYRAHLTILLPVHIVEMLVQAIKSVLDSGSVQMVSYSLELTGKTAYHDVKIIPIHTNLSMVLIQDVTQLHLDKIKLESSNALLNSILTNLIIDVFVYDRSGNLSFSNRNLETNYRKNTVDEAIECGLDFINPITNTNFTKEELPIYKASVENVSACKVLIKKEKGFNPKTYIVHAAPLLSDTGKNRGVVMTLRDITDLSMLQTKFDSKTKDLETFLYKSSHDLKSPLTSMKGILDFAQSKLVDPEALKYLDMILKSHSHLSCIVEDLIGLAHVSRKKDSFSVINVNTFINEIIQSLMYLPQADHIKIKVCIPESLTITSDENQLRAILQNLITNAICHHRKTGDDKYILIMAYDGVDNLLIEVVDNGIGIGNEMHSKVFDVFYRGNPGVPGSGLGLYIVKEAIQKLSGTIELESTLGEGSTFSIVVPKTV